MPEPRYREMRVFGIPGSPPSLVDPPTGCRFHPRCGVAYAECDTEEPPHVGDELRFAKCFWAKKHPGESVPLEAVTSDSLAEADPVGTDPRRRSRRHDDVDGPAPPRGDGAEVRRRTVGMSEDVLVATGVTKTFGHGKNAVEAVKDVSFALAENEVVTVVGESGSGKSTLARMVLGLMPITSGTMTFRGNDVSKMNARAGPTTGRTSRRSSRTRSPRSTSSSPCAGCWPARCGCWTTRSGTERLEEALGHVGFPNPADVLDRYPHQLSGGQRQRVMIARALMMRPKLLVADEATSMLDASLRVNVLNVLTDLREQLGMTILFITHDIGQACYVADRVLVMEHGVMVEQGPRRGRHLPPAARVHPAAAGRRAEAARGPGLTRARVSTAGPPPARTPSGSSAPHSPRTARPAAGTGPAAGLAPSRRAAGDARQRGKYSTRGVKTRFCPSTPRGRPSACTISAATSPGSIIRSGGIPHCSIIGVSMAAGMMPWIRQGWANSRTSVWKISVALANAALELL